MLRTESLHEGFSVFYVIFKCSKDQLQISDFHLFPLFLTLISCGVSLFCISFYSLVWLLEVCQSSEVKSQRSVYRIFDISMLSSKVSTSYINDGNKHLLIKSKTKSKKKQSEAKTVLFQFFYVIILRPHSCQVFSSSSSYHSL